MTNNTKLCKHFKECFYVNELKQLNEIMRKDFLRLLTDIHTMEDLKILKNKVMLGKVKIENEVGQ